MLGHLIGGKIDLCVYLTVVFHCCVHLCAHLCVHLCLVVLVCVELDWLLSHHCLLMQIVLDQWLLYGVRVTSL